MDTDSPDAACPASTGFGLRREAERHAAFGCQALALGERFFCAPRHSKAVSPLRSATAVQDAAALPRRRPATDYGKLTTDNPQ